MTIEAKLDRIIALLEAAAGGTTAAPTKAAGKAATPSTPAGAPAALDYERDVKALVLKVAKEAPGKRDAVVAINTAFGVESANKLKPEQWPAYIDACNKALTEKPLA